MEAKDLRLGNWVKANGLYEGTEMQVDEIGSRGSMYEGIRVILFKDAHTGEFVKDCEGIPLTEEWLLNLGFEKKYKFFYQSGLYAVRHMTDGNYVFSLHFSSEDHTPLASIKYVHQLQNLYFALTGE